MRNGKSIIRIVILICIAFIPVTSAETSQKKPIEKPPSTWELIRKAQVKKADSAEPAMIDRVIHFPKERSLGRLMIQDSNAERRIKTFKYGTDGTEWENFSEAQGRVAIPAGKRLSLFIGQDAWKDLSPLANLGADDLYMLGFSNPNNGSQVPDDRCMPHIVNLTGLKVLTLGRTNASAKGLKYLSSLSSLERLYAPSGLTNDGLAEIARLSSLRALYIRDHSLTNAGLAHLAKLPLLEELELVGKGRVNDPGLAHLAKIPHLKYLMLEGLVFTDAGMAHLKNCPSLRILDLSTQKKLTNSTLIHLSEIPQLERISFYWNENITDEGIAHLTKLKSLSMLNIKHSKVTCAGLIHLAKIKTLVNLTLPDRGVTDAGIEHIAQLHNLKKLWAGSSSSTPLTDRSLKYISSLINLEELNIHGAGLSDEGMKDIAKLKKLRRLSISSKHLTNVGLAELAGLESLTYLSIGPYTGITTSGLNSLNSLKKLKRLSIRDIRRDDSVMDISRLTELESLTLALQRRREDDSIVSDSFRNEDWACLANLVNLKNLQICGKGIDNEGVKHLSGLRNLEFLNIFCRGEERITDEALKYVAGMHKLGRLCIKDGHFTDKSLDYLDGLLSLSSLELTSDYAFSNKAIQDFQRKNPNITRLQLIP